MFYIAPKKASVNPSDYYKHVDAYISESFETHEAAAAVLGKMPPSQRKFMVVIFIHTPDTFVSRGYDTREEAAEALEVIEAINTMLAEKSNLCIIEHDQNKMPTQRLRQPFGF